MKTSSRRWPHILMLALLCLTLSLILTREWPDTSAESYLYGTLIHNRRFDFISWEVNALGGKFLYSLSPPHSYLEQEDQKELLLAYFDQLREVQSLEREIAAVYADPAVSDPQTASRDLRAGRDRARDDLERLRPLAEGVLEEQIAAVLADEGLGFIDQTFPPVKLAFTPLPTMLVISPRDRIEAIHFFSLEHGMETKERVELEGAIDEKMNVSSLVTNIGGLAAYPAMMLESSSLDWIVQTGAHEWTHHYLTLHPLGILYDSDPQLRTMNETVASIVGTEVGYMVLRQLFPERFVPTPTPTRSSPETSPAQEVEPPAFDFASEMHTTRVHVDQLLAEGKIEEAEEYMEERRSVFWDHGYQIRKLNQAYFAFYGGYADEAGARGSDPVGPAVIELRARSESLKEFLQTMAPLTSFAELEAILNSQQ